MPSLCRFSAVMALTVTLMAGSAQAHALLLSFALEGHEVTLRYNGRIDAVRSRLSLLQQDGTVLQKLDCQAGPDPATLKSHLDGIAAGAYILRWEVLSVDGHLSRGDQTLVLPAP